MMFAAITLLASATQFTTIQASCLGGVAGRRKVVRLASDGRLTRSEGWPDKPFVPAGRISRTEARALAQRLDRAGFDTLTSLPQARMIYDGVSCSLIREGAKFHELGFAAGAASPPPTLEAAYAEARAVMSEILKAADRVNGNPRQILPAP